ncbi:ABC transporter ATP-binding protein [Uliginosibacterium gangwonense]|uniref:ABC transporter ATP-binding protein n=1 Tax=Uliginosibacterium gangwonense TaxID=392736 RepID=UPI00037C0A14|nr:ABC transporter ATP-binding protein [Uliginosibacterium gangwonense]
MNQPLIEFDRLSVEIHTKAGIVRAAQDVSFSISAGQTVALVGESGCGKSISALSLMGLLPSAARVASGEIRYQGAPLTGQPRETLRRLRGNDLAMIFQEPMSALNPVLTIGEQIVEPLIKHQRLRPKAAWVKAVALLDKVGLARPDKIAESYPHELSGGMLQRAMIAMSMSCQPKLLIADEPTTALDVTISAQILDLLQTLQKSEQMALLLITHDLGVVAQMADFVVVMYAGRVVESGPVRAIFKHPQHPYTQGLLAARPVPGARLARLPSIRGQVPNPMNLPEYCSFAERCDQAQAQCRQGQPEYVSLGAMHQSACFVVQKREFA